MDEATDGTVELAALTGWLEPRLGAGPVTLTTVSAPSGGYSAETRIVDLVAGADATPHRVVLRRESPEPPVYPTQGNAGDVEVAIQHRVMAALAEAGTVPVARILGYEADPAVLGAPFFVMAFVDGEIPREDPIHTAAGFFFDAEPVQRRRMITSGLEALAAIHAVDWKAHGLGWLEPTDGPPDGRTQLRIWSDYAERELAGRRLPALEEAFTRLDAELPAGGDAVLCWGDARLGNIIWQDYRCACVTDFEAAHIGPPELDLGWWSMFDRWSHESMGHPRLAGEPTRSEQVAHYTAASGRDIGPIDVWELFAAARYAAIVVRVMNRLVERGHLPPDHTIWRDNPVATCLAEILDTQRPAG